MARFAGQQNWQLWGQNQQMDFPNKLRKAHWSRLHLETWQVATKCLVLSKILKLFCPYSAVTREDLCHWQSIPSPLSPEDEHFLKISPVEVKMERLWWQFWWQCCWSVQNCSLEYSHFCSFLFSQTKSRSTENVPQTIAGSQNHMG